MQALAKCPKELIEPHMAIVSALPGEPRRQARSAYLVQKQKWEAIKLQSKTAMRPKLHPVKDLREENEHDNSALADKSWKTIIEEHCEKLYNSDKAEAAKLTNVLQ